MCDEGDRARRAHVGCPSQGGRCACEMMAENMPSGPLGGTDDNNDDGQRTGACDADGERGRKRACQLVRMRTTATVQYAAMPKEGHARACRRVQSDESREREKWTLPRSCATRRAPRTRMAGGRRGADSVPCLVVSFNVDRFAYIIGPEERTTHRHTIASHRTTRFAAWNPNRAQREQEHNSVNNNRTWNVRAVRRPVTL